MASEKKLTEQQQRANEAIEREIVEHEAQLARALEHDDVYQDTDDEDLEREGPGTARQERSPSMLEALAMPFWSLWFALTRGLYRSTLLGRRLRIYAVAWYVKRQYTLAEAEAAKHPDGSKEQEEVWIDVHTRMAELCYSQMLHLEGLWVKLGQMMSTRADVLPWPWIQTLKNLQDSLPPKPFSEVEQTLQEAFGSTRLADVNLTEFLELESGGTIGRTSSPGRKTKSGSEGNSRMSRTSIGGSSRKSASTSERTSKSVPKVWPFRFIQEEPLATASIAQVHVARLLNGDKVVVKVQHRGIDAVIEQDLDNAHYIVESLAEDRPELDFRVIYEEWAAETRKELDFVTEARSTESIRSNLRHLAGAITVPRVVRDFWVPRATARGSRRRSSRNFSTTTASGPPNINTDTTGAAAQSNRESRTSEVSTAAKLRDGATTDIQDFLSVTTSFGAAADAEAAPSPTAGASMISVPVRPTKTVLVLEFIEGVKPTDKATLQSWPQADPKKLVEDISAAFAQQIFVDGVFNGDPHPGNILIERAVPHKVCLLDFGLVKRVPPALRRSFCKLIVAAHEMDVSGVLCALGELGVGEEASLAKPGRALRFVRFAFRDAQPGKTWADQKKEWKPEDEEKDKEGVEQDSGKDGGEAVTPVFKPRYVVNGRRMKFDLAEPEVVPIPADVKRWSIPRAASGSPRRSLSAASSSSTPANRAEVEDAKADVEEEKKTKKVSEQALAAAGGVIFLLRVISCLRGIAVSLGVGHSYLKSMAPFAKAALRNRAFEDLVEKAGRGVEDDSPGTTSNDALLLRKINPLVPAAPPLNATVPTFLYPVLQSLFERSLLTGVQIAVYKNGVPVIDAAYGELGSIDTRPMSPKSVINSFSCSKILPVLLLHVFLEKKYIDSIDDPVCKYWPSFAKNGKAKVTVKDLLEHKSGLAKAMPTKFAELKGGAIEAMTDFPSMKHWIASAKPVDDELGVEKYHALTYGWLLAGLAEEVYARFKHITASTDGGAAASGFRNYKSLVKEFVLQPLGLAHSDEVRITTTTDATTDSQAGKDEVATLGLSPHMLEVMGGGDLFGALSSPVEAPKPAEPSTNSMKTGAGSTASGEQTSTTASASGSGSAASSNSSSDNEGSRSNSSSTFSSGGLWMDPRAFNDPSVRRAVLPAANTHFSARALAAVYNALLDGMRADDENAPVVVAERNSCPSTSTTPRLRSSSSSCLPGLGRAASKNSGAAASKEKSAVVESETKANAGANNKILSAEYLAPIYKELQERSRVSAEEMQERLAAASEGLAQFLAQQQNRNPDADGGTNQSTPAPSGSLFSPAARVSARVAAAASLQQKSSNTSVQMNAATTAEPPQTYPLGFRVLKSGDALAFGYPGLFSNCALACPKDRVVVVVLVNQIDWVAVATREILSCLAENGYPAARSGLVVGAGALFSSSDTNEKSA